MALSILFLSIARKQKDRWIIGQALHISGVGAMNKGEYGKAEIDFNESLALFRESGTPLEINQVLRKLGKMAMEREDFTRAKMFFREVLEISGQPENRPHMCISYRLLGQAFIELGDYTQARECLTEAICLAREMGAKERIRLCLKSSAKMALSLNQFERAAKLIGAEERYSFYIRKTFRRVHQSYIEILNAELEKRNFTGSWDAGRAMTLEQAIEYALEDASSDESAPS